MSRNRIASGAIEITDFCNLKCVHCYVGEVCNPVHMKLNNIFYLIDEFINYGANHIVISGGEPLLHPNIEDIINTIGTKYANTPFVLTTNGSFLNKKNLDMIKKYTNIQIQISLDGATKEVHESQHGENTYENIMFALEHLKGIRRERKILHMTVSKLNYKECVKVAQMADIYNTEISYSYVCRVGRAKCNWDSLKMSLAQQMFVNEEINMYARRSTRDITPPQSILSCPFESEEYIFGTTIHTNGDVDICTCLDGKYLIGNAFNQSFYDIINSSTIDMLTKQIVERKNKLKSTKCQDCITAFRCRQGCIGRAAHLGDKFGLDGECQYRKALMFKNYYLSLIKKGVLND